jgi:hypothetical protein
VSTPRANCACEHPFWAGEITIKTNDASQNAQRHPTAAHNKTTMISSHSIPSLASKEANSSSATTATAAETEMSSIGSNECSQEDPPVQEQRGRTIRKKAQQEYLECLEALSATKLSDNTPPPLRKDPRRSVSFSSRSIVYCYEFSPTHDPKDLKDSIWYTSEDEDRFKADAREELDAFKLLKGLSSDEAKGEDNYPQHQRCMCIVGLEQHLVSPEHSKKRARARKLITHAVLSAQARGFGSERIAKTASRYSEWTVAQAKTFGDFQHIMSKK